MLSSSGPMPVHVQAAVAVCSCVPRLHPQVMEVGLHSFVVSLMGKGVPAMLCGHQRQIKAALDQIKAALEPLTVAEYLVDLFYPSGFVPKPFKFEQAQLMLLSTVSITDFTV